MQKTRTHVQMVVRIWASFCDRRELSQSQTIYITQVYSCLALRGLCAVVDVWPRAYDSIMLPASSMAGMANVATMLTVNRLDF
jgi:hypothetical protein